MEYSPFVTSIRKGKTVCNHEKSCANFFADAVAPFKNFALTVSGKQIAEVHKRWGTAFLSDHNSSTPMRRPCLTTQQTSKKLHDSMGNKVPKSAKFYIRDDFRLPVKRTLANRVGLQCSNPYCMADTSGPQSDPSKALNVGVAAHITAAARGGPRYDLTLTDKERASAANGIWLCQTCAHKVDTDPEAYPVHVLRGWKAQSEHEAKARLGKTKDRTKARSKSINALKRDHKMRDDLHRDFLKSPQERMNLPRMANRSAKFAYSEAIIHKIEDDTYPNIDADRPGISPWFKLELLDFYHGGLHGILSVECAIIDTETQKWALIPHELSKKSYPPRFKTVNLFVTGRIPWRNILHYDMSGDEYYPMPHLYCEFANAGEPYEGRGYFLCDGQGHEFEIATENRIELEVLFRAEEFPRL